MSFLRKKITLLFIFFNIMLIMIWTTEPHKHRSHCALGSACKMAFSKCETRRCAAFAFLCFSFIHFHFHARFSSGEGRGDSSSKRTQQQSQIVLFAPHQDGTKQGWRCSHATWSLDELWAAFPWL